jgi:hypothetical protein
VVGLIFGLNVSIRIAAVAVCDSDPDAAVMITLVVALVVEPAGVTVKAVVTGDAPEMVICEGEIPRATPLVVAAERTNVPVKPDVGVLVRLYDALPPTTTVELVAERLSWKSAVLITRPSGFEMAETTLVSLAHRVWTVTEYVPTVLQL